MSIQRKVESSRFALCVLLHLLLSSLDDKVSRPEVCHCVSGPCSSPGGGLGAQDRWRMRSCLLIYTLNTPTPSDLTFPATSTTWWSLCLSFSKDQIPDRFVKSLHDLSLLFYFTQTQKKQQTHRHTYTACIRRGTESSTHRYPILKAAAPGSRFVSSTSPCWLSARSGCHWLMRERRTDRALKGQVEKIFLLSSSSLRIYTSGD